MKSIGAVTMKDLIDERNERERISRSIIKYWNVNYIPKQPEPVEPEKMEEEQEVVESNESQLPSEVDYNYTTGAYSGVYGKSDVKDEVTKGQIDKILHEKSENLRHLIDENKEKE